MDPYTTTWDWDLASLLPNHVFLVQSTPSAAEELVAPASSSPYFQPPNTQYCSPYGAVGASAGDNYHITTTTTSSTNPSPSSSPSADDECSPPSSSSSLSSTDDKCSSSSSSSPSPETPASRGTSPTGAAVTRKRRSQDSIQKDAEKTRRTSETLTNDIFSYPYYYSPYGGDGASEAKSVSPPTYGSQYKQQKVHNTSAIQCNSSPSTPVLLSTCITQSQGRAHLGSANDATFQRGAQNKQQPVHRSSVAQNGTTLLNSIPSSTHIAHSQGRAPLGSANDATCRRASPVSTTGVQSQQQVHFSGVAQNGTTPSSSVLQYTCEAKPLGHGYSESANDATFHQAAPTPTTRVQFQQQQVQYTSGGQNAAIIQNFASYKHLNQSQGHTHFGSGGHDNATFKRASSYTYGRQAQQPQIHHPSVQYRNIQPSRAAAVQVNSQRVAAPVEDGNFQETRSQYIPPPPPEFSEKWTHQECAELLQPGYQFCLAYERKIPYGYRPLVLFCAACNDGTCLQCAVHYCEREHKIPHLLSSLAKYKDWQCRTAEKLGDQELLHTVNLRVDWLNKRLEYAEEIVANLIAWHTMNSVAAVVIDEPGPASQPQYAPPPTVTSSQGPSNRCPNTGRFGPGNTPANKGVAKSSTKPHDNNRVTKKTANAMPVNGKLWRDDDRKPAVRRPRGRPSKGPTDILNASKRAAVEAALSATAMPGY